MINKKIDKAIMECYTELYKHSTPQADFEELVKNAEIIDGVKVIPFMDYEIEEELMDKIIKETFKKYKLPKYMEARFRVSIYLGCSPKRKLK